MVKPTRFYLSWWTDVNFLWYRKGRDVSGYYSIKDDLINAGGNFVDAGGSSV